MIPNTPQPTSDRKLHLDIRAFPLLSAEDELELSRRWRDQQDVAAANKIVTSHLRLVASGYRAYGLPVGDLMSEGSLGLMQAVKRYDPERGIRFSTYARWWIRSAIQEHIMHSWSLVKVGTTAAQRKLFFKLRQLKSQMQILDEGDLLPEDAASIARRLAVPEEDVIHMNRRLTAPALSLNMPMRHDAEDEWQDCLADQSAALESSIADREELSMREALLPSGMSTLSARERHILTERRLREKPTSLGVLSEHYGISRERVRQIEMRAFEKLQKSIKAQWNQHKQGRSCSAAAKCMPGAYKDEARRAPQLMEAAI
jgi:RNA polymerase sigma-32 factor